MERLLVIAAVLVGAYALWAGQNPTRAFKPSVPSALFAPSGTPAAAVSKSAVGSAGRVGN